MTFKGEINCTPDLKFRQYIMEINFPQKNDQLFSNNFLDWRNNACLNYMHYKFPSYADGYKEGAQKLIEVCLNGDGTMDNLIYPVAFLFRQYIELQLKDFIIGLNYCVEGSQNFPVHHKIDILWKEFIRLYKLIGEEPNNEDFVNAERIILEFASVDPKSMAFRYPVSPNGENTLNLNLVNLRNFAEVMGRLVNLLDAISDQIATYKEFTGDMYRDWNYGH